MKKEHLLKVLLSPHVSEKTSATAGEKERHAFKVLSAATKPEIRQAVELLFEVKVDHVRTCNMKSKPTRFGRILGKRKPWKKAYVTLQAGQHIEAGEVEA